jgi:hypothetical protein
MGIIVNWHNLCVIDCVIFCAIIGLYKGLNMNNKVIAQIYPMQYSKNKTQEEVDKIIPILQSLSTKTAMKLSQLNTRVMYSNNQILAQEEINNCILQWVDTVRRLGAKPVSLHKVVI